MIEHVLNSILTTETGFYVDVGAGDGVTDNLSYPFYQRGWRGICIEPDTRRKNSGKKQRPEDTWVYGAATKRGTTERIDYFFEPTYKFGGTRVDEAAMREYYTAIGRTVELKKRSVRAYRLDELLDKNKAEQLDLLIIRVNGDERAVLDGLRLEKWQARLIVIERKDTSVVLLLRAYDYEIVYQDANHWVLSTDGVADVKSLVRALKHNDEV